MGPVCVNGLPGEEYVRGKVDSLARRPPNFVQDLGFKNPLYSPIFYMLAFILASSLNAKFSANFRVLGIYCRTFYYYQHFQAMTLS